jgi:hypothetical protein
LKSSSARETIPRMKRWLLLMSMIVAQGCGGGGGSTAAAGATAAPIASAAPVTSASAAPVASTIDIAALVRAMEARRAGYVAHSATGHGHYAELAKLELGLPIDRAPLDHVCDVIDARPDTADFSVTALQRIVFLHGTSPAIPQDLRDRFERALLGFRYWIDEPNPDAQVFWSENHYLMYATAEYLAGQRWPTATFGNSGLTGDQHRQKALPRLRRWLRERLRFGYSEWHSPVYYPHDVAPLLNLIDFAQDAELRARAAMALDLLIFDLARLTHRGSFGLTAGRVYEEHKVSGRAQSIADLIELLFGTRGGWQFAGSTAATTFATSRAYRAPHALLAIGVDKDVARSIDRARVGLRFSEAAGEGVGFQDLEDGLLWWREGGYMAPETIVLTRRMIDAWGLWGHDAFAPLRPFRTLPDAALVLVTDLLGPATKGSLLGGANLYCFRTPDAQLSSVIDYQAGRIGFQQHAWQATLDLDAAVFTTAPGNLGHDGPTRWTGSATLPQVAQHEDVALILYDPPLLQQLAFPAETHAFFPRAAFDEVVERGAWTFGRKGQGYVALYSALPTSWTRSGPDADREKVAYGERNAWICQVGRAAEDGSFADFVDAISRARVVARGEGSGARTATLSIEYDAPGAGTLRAAWRAPATLNGAPLHPADFPRFDNAYASQAWGDRTLTIRHAGLTLEHDQDAGTRQGDGL